MRSFVRASAIAMPAIVGAALSPAATARAQEWTAIGDPITVTAGPTSTNVQLSWVATGEPAPPVAIICNSGTVPAYIALGGAGLVVTARRPPEAGLTLGTAVSAKGCRILRVGGGTNIAAIAPAGPASLSIQTGIGEPIGTIATTMPSAGLTWGGVSLTWGGINITGL